MIEPPELSRESEYAECKSRLSARRTTVAEYGLILQTVKLKELYKLEYKTWEEFCRTEEHLTARHANRIIEAQEVIAQLKNAPEKSSPNEEPENNEANGTSRSHSSDLTESHARALKKVRPECRQAVLDFIKKSGKEITEKTIEEAIVQVFPKPPQSNKDAREPEIRRDSTGYKIPQHRWFLFERGAEIKALLSKLSEVRCAVRKAQEENDILFMSISHSLLISEIDVAYADLEEGVPYAVCPDCQGETFEQCRSCDHRGAISKHIYDNAVNSDLKAVRDKMCVK